MRVPGREDVPAAEFEDVVREVFEALKPVKDFRSLHGRQIELRGTLALIILALASGVQSYRRIALFGRQREGNLIPLLGLNRAPSASTVRRIVMGADQDEIREVLRRSGIAALAGRRVFKMAVDGKTLRGARRKDGSHVQVVDTSEPETGVVLDSRPCARNEGELTAGRKLFGETLDRMPQVQTGTADALYPDEASAREVVDRGRDYLFKVKENKATLFEEVKTCFEPGAPIADTAAETEKGHGRIVERTCRTSQVLHGYSELPGLHQAGEVTRRTTVQKTGEVSVEVRYAVTSASPRKLNAKGFMDTMRGHWGIENRNFHVRDDTWREDRQVIRNERGAFAMHVFLGVAMNLLRTSSRFWKDDAPMTTRIDTLRHTLSVCPETCIRNDT